MLENIIRQTSNGVNLYKLPEINFKTREKLLKAVKNRIFWLWIILIVFVIVYGLLSGAVSFSGISGYVSDRFGNLFKISEKAAVEDQKPIDTTYKSDISYEQAIIDAVRAASPSVVSIIISKNMPVYEQEWIDPFGGLGPFGFQIPQYVQKGTEKKDIGEGSGFIISADGLIATNKHVVLDKDADYTVLTNDGQKFSAKVLALDPVQDLAVIKIHSEGKIFPAIKLGDSSGIQIGQGVIAIGNALGQFSNTVSVGIVSGLQRTISASDQRGSFSETLEGIIQTDAAINSGNSGGPLLNLKGEVIGINVAMAQGAENIGFAIPVNAAKRDIDQVIKTNKIVYPFLGVRYRLVDGEVKEKYDLAVDYGALVLAGENGEPAVTPESAAAKAGIKSKDIILEFNGEKISKDNPMSKIILKYNPGDKVILKILRGKEEISLDATLGER